MVIQNVDQPTRADIIDALVSELRETFGEAVLPVNLPVGRGPAVKEVISVLALPHVPKHENVECAGVEVRLTDAAAARPYQLGLELLVALSKQPGFSWRDGGKALTWLLGTDQAFAALSRGAAVEEILGLDRAAHDAWRAQRRAFLLYE